MTGGKTSDRGRRRSAAQDAWSHALRLLARRPRTERELADALDAAGCDLAERDAVLRRLREAGHLDDDRLALHYILARSERLGHGRERLLRELTRRGVERARAAAAWEAAVRDHGLDPDTLLARQIERRLPAGGGGLDARAYRRVYNALLRAGFEASSLIRALRPHRAFDDPIDEIAVRETDDDVF